MEMVKKVKPTTIIRKAVKTTKERRTKKITKAKVKLFKVKLITKEKLKKETNKAN